MANRVNPNSTQVMGTTANNPYIVKSYQVSRSVNPKYILATAIHFKLLLFYAHI